MSLRSHPLETLLSTLAGWLPLLGGLTLLGMTLITPEWLSWREMVWQRDMLKLQAESMQTQRERYAAFYDALESDDPALLERLAFTHLRYKPADKKLMDNLWVTSVPARGVQGSNYVAVNDPTFSGNDEVIESWLASPLPVVGQDIQPLRPINTRMTRMTSGTSRYVLLAVAIICMIAGLWPEKSEQENVEEAVEVDTDKPEQPRPPFRIRAA